MQKSFWKLVSVVGVVAIGTLVVLEVQERLPIEGTALQDTDQPEDGAVGSDHVVIAPTDTSEFERATDRTVVPFDDASETAAGTDLTSFDDLLQEPDLPTAGDRFSSPQTAELGTDRDPFAEEPEIPDFEFGSDVAGESPVRPAGFVDDSRADEPDDSDFLNFAVGSEDLPAAANDSPFEGDSVPVVLPDETVAPRPEPEPELSDIPFAPDPLLNDPAEDAVPEMESRHASGGDRLQFFSQGDAPDTGRAPALTPADDNDFSLPAPSLPDREFREDTPAPEPLEILDFNEPDTDGARPPLRRDSDRTDESASEFDSPFAPEFRSRREPDSRPDIDTARESDSRTDLLMFGEEENEDAQPFTNDMPEFREEPREQPRFNPDRRPLPRETTPDRSAPRPRADDEFGFPDSTNPGEDERFSNDWPPADDELSREPTAAPDRQPRRPAPERDDRFSEPEFMDIPPLDDRPRRSDDSNFELEIRPAEPADSAATATGVLKPHLTVAKQMQETATLGVPMTYTLIVTNEGASSASDVVIEDVVPVAARVEQADPPADYDRETRKLVWEFAELPAGASRELRVEITPIEQGRLNSVATVRFKARVAASTVVQAPRLTLDMTIPREVKVGSRVQLKYFVRNVGDGTASDVMLRSDLPAGLQHPIGDDLEYSIEQLAPGEEREIVLDVLAAEPGEFTNTAEIMAAGMAAETAEEQLRIIGQQIQVARRGPQRRYVGRSAVYENILTNDTAFEASGVRVLERVPEGMTYKDSSPEGIYNPQERLVTWELDRIDPGKTETLKIKLVADSPGNQESSVTVIENAGYETAARQIIAVEDLHNIGMRMSVLRGPVSVGQEFGFDILVKNRGTADATGVQLVIDLPEGLKGVSVGKGGPKANPKIEDGQLQYHFEPVSRIEPDREMTFRINLQATQPVSNGIVNARIRYDQMKQELITSEAVTASDDAP